jgi:uncharacterized protein
MTNVEFEWDEAKDHANQAKHGVSFNTALRVFSDPFCLIEHDRIEDGEQRWQALGLIDSSVLLLVAHVTWDEEDDGGQIEIIRIISARKATRPERRRYENQRQ